MSSIFYKALVCRVAALVVALVCGFISLKLYKQYLPLEVYGVVVVALQLLNYLPYLDGGFRTATNREILSRPGAVEKLPVINFTQSFYSLFALVVFPAAVALMVLYSFTPTITSSGQPRAFFVVIGLTAAAGMVGWSQIGLLVGLGAQASFYAMNALNGGVTLLALWLSLRAGMGIWAFPIATFAGMLVCYPVALRLIRALEPRIRFFQWKLGPDFWKHFRDLGHEAWPCFRVEVVSLLLYSADLVLVGQICGANAAAIYGVVSRLATQARTFLQATGEVAWPLVATRSGRGQALGDFLLRFNGWLIGSTVGAMALTMGPFIGYFMGASWTPSRQVVLLVTGRLLVTGTCSAAPYLLMGLGQFGVVAKYSQRELLAAVIMGVSLSLLMGMAGVAMGFLLSTIFGTFASYYYAYGRAVNVSGGRLMWQAWWRSLMGYAVAVAVSAVVLRWSHSAWQTFIAGAVSALAALLMGAVVCGFRIRRSRNSSPVAFKLGDLVANI